jgi:hypothetical protein
MAERNVDIVQSARNATVYIPQEAIDLSGYPVKAGWFEEGFNNDLTDSNPAVAWPGLEYWTGTIGDITAEWRFPDRFKAVHCSLIPKGPHRGRLLLWDGSPVIARCTATSNQWWSWQSIVILDLAPNAPIRCRNYILPVAPIIDPAVPGLNVYKSFFCSGHAWTEYGDLVIAGGNIWLPTFNAFNYQGLWVWNPDHVGAAAIPLSGDNSPPSYVNINTGHYSDFGAWVFHGKMKRGRWYASVKTTPRYSQVPYNNKSGVLVFGGSFNPSENPAGGDPSWKNYEAFVVDGSPVCTVGGSTSGLTQDNRTTGNTEEPGVFYGPLTGSHTYQEMFDDSFIYYPHVFQLSNGSFYMCGMARDAATLADHGANPGVWTSGPGVPVTGDWTKERMYASSVLAPNYDGIDDRVIIFGGANYGTPPYASTNSSKIIAASTPGSNWVYLPDGNYPSTEQNLVVAPDGDIHLFGGADKSIIPVENGGSGSFTADLHTKPQRLAINPASATKFDTKWELLEWTPAEAYRDYHSTAMLLPDGRIFTGGGDSSSEPIDPNEPSHGHNPTASDHPGYDYELFYPRYLRPSEIPSIAFPRPAGVTLTLQNGTAVSQTNGCYNLSYNTFYHAVVTSIGPFRALGHVVLMAPGSRTHHIDFSEIYHKPTHPQTLHNAFTINFKTPQADHHLPRGYYMLFVLDDNRVPSEAIWIKL